MAGAVERVAMVSMHTSPAAQPGRGDSGGMNVALLALAAELALRQVEVHLVTRTGGAPSSRTLLGGVTLHELPAGAGALGKDELAGVTDEFGEAVASFARGAAIDVLHSHYWLSGIATLPVALELGIPLVHSYHTLASMKTKALGKGGGEPLQRLHSERYLATQADALVASSSAEATALIDDIGAPADRTWIVRPGVDLELFAPRPVGASSQVLRRRLGLDFGRPMVALVGRVQPLKGHELAVRAIAQLRESVGWAPLLVIVGESTAGAERFVTRLRDLADQLGVTDDVLFAGSLPRDEVAEVLAAADLTLVPSFSETFGLVALESAASGTPVVGFRADGLTESISDGRSGVLLDTRDPEEWADAISALLDDDQRREELGRTAREFAENFSWGTAAAALLDVYSSVVR